MVDLYRAFIPRCRGISSSGLPSCRRTWALAVELKRQTTKLESQETTLGQNIVLLADKRHRFTVILN